MLKYKWNNETMPRDIELLYKMAPSDLKDSCSGGCANSNLENLPGFAYATCSTCGSAAIGQDELFVVQQFLLKMIYRVRSEKKRIDQKTSLNKKLRIY